MGFLGFVYKGWFAVEEGRKRNSSPVIEIIFLLGALTLLTGPKFRGYKVRTFLSLVWSVMASTNPSSSGGWSWWRGKDWWS